jgi:serine/threonine protein kinase/uncharacterized membrane protein YhaH (DUF805 family)
MKCPKCNTENGAEARFCAECGTNLAEVRAKAAEPQIDFGALRTMDEGETKNPRQPSNLLPNGTIFADRYEILQTVGEGGMGVVYRAKDRVTERDVALKLIRADKLGGPDQVKRLIREGVTSRDIRHPNVVAVYDVGETGGQPYMSMEFLAGKSLRAWNRQRMQSGAEVSMRTAAHIVAEILNGLEAAHKAGVIHRDLKPENVILMSDPTDQGVQLKLLDFGIARVGGGGDTGATSLGTRGYMAPEQVTAPDAAQPAADLYSLSVMFYELLVGVVPQGHWQPPSGGRSDVSFKIDELIQKGLSNNPRVRPQTVADYRRMLEEGMRGSGAASWGQPTSNTGGGGGFKPQGLIDNVRKSVGPGPGGMVTPGAGPAGPTGNMFQLFIYCMKNYANGKGRANRMEYWSFTLFSMLVFFVCYFVDIAISVDSGEAQLTFTILWFLGFVTPSTAVTARRLHDLNLNGWITAACFFVSIGYLIVGIPRGTVGDNQYGPDPLGGRQV